MYIIGIFWISFLSQDISDRIILEEKAYISKYNEAYNHSLLTVVFNVKLSVVFEINIYYDILHDIMAFKWC